MKVTHAGSHQVETSGVEVTNAFKIARTPHMFNILSSGLYSDKIAAVLREVGCNAMDAHIMAGTPDKPIQVKLPTNLDRSFYIKDWGPGLDDSEARELYTTYGWSSKQNDNSVTGAFGLGSKSPFAYTAQHENQRDGFTIVAVKNGFRRTYTCYLDEQGAPVIARLDESPADADWPHGVMVTFPVQPNDIQAFHAKAVEVFSWFKVHPEILGLRGGMSLVSPKYAQSINEFVRIYPKELPQGQSGPCVVTGGVRYPLDLGKLSLSPEVFSAFRTTDVGLFLPVGEVLMTPSREQLQYTIATKENLEKRLNAAFEAMAKKFVKAIAPQPDEPRLPWLRRVNDARDKVPSSLISINGIKRLLEVGGAQGLGISSDELHDALANHYIGMPEMVGTRVPQGFRVYYVLSGDERAKYNPVIRGEIPSRSSNGQATPIRLNLRQPIRVFYSDSPYALKLVRAYVQDHPEHVQALLVTTTGKERYAQAKQIADSYVGVDGLHGLETEGTKSLMAILPKETVEQAVSDRPRLKKGDSLEEFFKDSEVTVLDAQRGTYDATTLGEAREETMLYVVSNRDKFFNKLANDSIFEIPAGYVTEFKRSLGGLMQAGHLQNVRKVIVLDSQAEVRSLRLVDQGYKPWLPQLQAEVRKLKEPLFAQVQFKPRYSRIDDEHYARYAGVLGVCVYAANKKPRIYEKFIQTLGVSHPLVDTCEYVVSNQVSDNQALEDKYNKDHAPLRYWLNLALRTNVPAAQEQAQLSSSLLNYRAVQALQEEKAPSLKMLEADHFVKLLLERPVSAAKLVQTLMEVCEPADVQEALKTA